MTPKLLHDAEAVLAFLNRVSWRRLAAVATDRGRVGVWICPWQGTAVPWFNIAVALLLRRAGYAVSLLHDDQAFEDNAAEAEQCALIERVLAAISADVLPVRRAAAGVPCDIGTDEAQRIAQLATCNRIRMRMTSVGIEDDGAAIEELRRRLDANYRRLKPLAADGWSFMLAPGGLYANSGLYMLAGRQAGVRVATYDAGYGRLFVGTDDVACYFYDDLRTLDALLARHPAQSPELAPLIVAARAEFEARLAGTDAQRFQTVASGSTELPEFDVVIPMSIDWDAPGLGRNRFFTSPARWVRETVEYLLTRTTATVAFRQHPYIRHVDWWDKRDGYREVLGDLIDAYPQRFVFYPAEAPVNTYDLIRRSRVVLPYVSAIGIEAAFLRKPVIVESSAHYMRLPFAHVPQSRDDYFRLVDEGIAGRLAAPDADSVAVALLYFHIFQTAHYLFTTFTPQPNDFAQWVDRDFEALADEPELRTLVDSLCGNRPISDIVISGRLTAPRPEPLPAPTPEPESMNPDLSTHFPDVAFGHQVQIIGLANTEIGRYSCIGDDCWLNICVRDERTRLRIGRSVLIGRQGMVSVGDSVEIGDFCLFAPRVFVSSADHIFADIARPYIVQGATTERRLVIEENCWLGINAVVSGHLTVGRGSVIGANSVVNSDVPPFCVVAGNPAVVVKMYNPRSGCWEKTPDAGARRRVAADRVLAGLPDRDAYRGILSTYANARLIDPIVAGRGESI